MPDPAAWLLRAVDVDGRAIDVRLADGMIMVMAEHGQLRPEPGEAVLEGGGGALLPGLHDHHLHLPAMAAFRSSILCGPPEVTDREGLAAALRSGPPGLWVRGVGYDESVAGELDRAGLDTLVADRPVRLQHRSGHLWMVNSAAAAELGIAGHPTGRLFGMDAVMRSELGDSDLDFAAVGTELAAFGVTEVTDATPGLTMVPGPLPQRVHVLGPSKVVLAEHELPEFDALVAGVEAIHAADRSVAVHCVSRATLVLALAAFDAAGPRPGDRVEHASVAPPELVGWIARLGLTVATQPGFVVQHEQRYRAEVDPDDLPWLYRVRGFLDAGVPVLGSTDAPFGEPDPWRAMQAAVWRDLGVDERVTPEVALGLFTDGRLVRPGAAADLCLLSVPWAEARRSLDAGLVTSTFVGGMLV